MASRSPVLVLVTGGQRGIGLAIVKALCRHLGENGVVYLSTLDEECGLEAVDLLKKEGLHPRSHVLDVRDRQSIETLRDDIVEEHGGLDILVNNAGVSYEGEENMPLSIKAEITMQVNFFGLLHVTEAFLPFIRDGGRIVNIASGRGARAFKLLSKDREKMFKEVSTPQGVADLMNEFVEATKRGDDVEEGWPDLPYTAYATSKLGVATLTRVYAQQLSQDRNRKDILVNCCHPGSVATQMTAYHPPNRLKPWLTPDEGADTPVYLALLPACTTGIQGQYVYKRTVYDIFNHEFHD